ncbi:MAG TPA: IS256 family transposase [Verrucomicrobiales bacterium]|nr:IS256 family transposase [Verrucomicrobiales bacterium]
MNDHKENKTAAQAGIEDFNGIFQEQLRVIVRKGLLAMFEQEVNALCGEFYRPSESVYRRAGSEAVTIQTTSGKELIWKRRVREMLANGQEREVKLESYSEVKRRKGMFDEVLEAICHGASGKGVSKMLGVSTSTVCEGWKARSKELLDEFRGRDLSQIDVVAMMVDGVFPAKESCVVVALAIDVDGNKHLLDFEEGSSESAEVVKGLFARLHARGLQVGTARRLLLVRDGSEAIAKAVRHFWPDAVQQECLVHVERGLCGKLSWKHQREVVNLMNRLRAVEGAEAGDEAFEALLSFVKGKNLGAAESLESRKDGILSFHRLNVPSTLNVTFLSTNHIENVMRNSRGVIGKVSRWNAQTDQLTRWMGVALLRAQEGFRRVRGHKEMGALAAALGRSGSVALSLRSASTPPDRPSAGEQIELVKGHRFSYQFLVS